MIIEYLWNVKIELFLFKGIIFILEGFRNIVMLGLCYKMKINYNVCFIKLNSFRNV